MKKRKKKHQKHLKLQKVAQVEKNLFEIDSIFHTESMVQVLINQSLYPLALEIGKKIIHQNPEKKSLRAQLAQLPGSTITLDEVS